MAAERPTPIDEFSGIPLPFSPAHMQDRPSNFAPDEHHPWHDRKHPLLYESTGGLALRASRVQIANYGAHHLDYHRAYAGPELPATDEERLRPIVLAAAGYIPQHGLAFSSRGRPYIVNLSEKTRRDLWARGKIHMDRVDRVRQFLLEYTMNQDLSDISENCIDEFLHTPDMMRRKELGEDILGRATRRATDPVKAVYQEAYAANLLPPDRATRAARFVLKSLSVPHRRASLYDQLQARLITS
jgi:hypothetical protein